MEIVSRSQREAEVEGERGYRLSAAALWASTLRFLRDWSQRGGASSRVYCTVEHRVPGRLVVAAVCYGIVDAQTDTARRTQTHRVADPRTLPRPSDGSEEKYRPPELKVGHLEYFDCVHFVGALVFTRWKASSTS